MRSGWACPVRSGTTEHFVHVPISAWRGCSTFPIIRPDRFGQASDNCELFQDSHQLVSAHCPLGDDGYRLMSCVILHRKALDAAPLGHAIKHEVHGPHLVAGRWALQGMSVAQRYLLASAPLHLQTRLGIQAIYALVIHDLACLAQLQIDHHVAISIMALGQGDDLLLEHVVAVVGRLVALGTGAHANDTQATSIAHP